MNPLETNHAAQMSEGLIETSAGLKKVINSITDFVGNKKTELMAIMSNPESSEAQKAQASADMAKLESADIAKMRDSVVQIDAVMDRLKTGLGAAFKM